MHTFLLKNHSMNYTFWNYLKLRRSTFVWSKIFRKIPCYATVTIKIITLSNVIILSMIYYYFFFIRVATLVLHPHFYPHLPPAWGSQNHGPQGAVDEGGGGGDCGILLRLQPKQTAPQVHWIFLQLFFYYLMVCLWIV